MAAPADPEPADRSTGRGPDPGAHAARPATFRRLPLVLLALVLVASLVAMSVAWLLRPRHLTAPAGPGIPRVTPRAEQAPVRLPTAWRTSAEVLREGQGTNPVLAHPMDGLAASAGGFVDAGGSWLVASLAEPRDEDSAQLHGVDPATGRARWTRPMPGALCADTPVEARFACLSVTQRDPATGLGTSWRLHLLDPATGRSVRSTTLAGTVVGLRAMADGLVVVRQDRPAVAGALPRVVVQLLAPDLAARWSSDLTARAASSALRLLFSTDRLLLRGPQPPSGPALFNPSLDPVGQGLLALSSAAGVALLRVADGSVVVVRSCTTLGDDGQRLWCNTEQRAVALSRDGRRALVSTEPGIRLLSVRTAAPRGTPLTPVFARADGTLVRVDAATGATTGELAQDLAGQPLGLGTPVRVVQGAGLTVVSDEQTTTALGPDGSLRWRSGQVPELQQLWLQQRIGRGQRLWLLGRDTLHLVDAREGWLQGSYRVADVQRLQLAGQGRSQVLAGWGSSTLARVRVP